MSKLKFGWAEQSITPDKKVSLAGQFAERISEYVEKPICVTALAISSETDQAIFCACDLVDISWGLRDAVRAKLAGNDAGLDPMKVIILSLIHIYSARRARPDRWALWPRPANGPCRRWAAPPPAGIPASSAVPRGNSCLLYTSRCV